MSLAEKSRSIPEGFEPPSFHAPVDVAAVIRQMPPGATAKGIFYRALVREGQSVGQHFDGFGPYRDFKDYPLTEACRLLEEVGRRLYPDETLRSAIRRLGWVIFPTLLGTMPGRVVFGALGNDMAAVVANAHKGFEISVNDGRCEVLRVAPGLGHLRLTGFHLFPDCFLVGVFEGAFAHYGIEPEIHVRSTGRYDCEYLFFW